MDEQIQNKAITLPNRERAANVARRLLSMSRDAEFEGPWADVCRGLAHDALKVAERELTTEEHAVIETKLNAIRAVLGASV